MLILKILAALALLYTLYEIAIAINKFTHKRYRYLFLNQTTLATSILGYGGLFVGYNWYMSALAKHGDILNGQILMGAGALLLIWTIYSNIKNTNLMTGVIFTFVQQILYMVATAIGAVIFAILIAAFAEAKPVYRID